MEIDERVVIQQDLCQLDADKPVISTSSGEKVYNINYYYLYILIIFMKRVIN